MVLHLDDGCLGVHLRLRLLVDLSLDVLSRLHTVDADRVQVATDLLQVYKLKNNIVYYKFCMLENIFITM